MGNRGCLHGAEGAIRRIFANKSWITCTLREKPGRGPQPFPVPGRWTPLFFLDEAVACAAGHRPCAECRRAVYNDFRRAWALAFGTVPKAVEIDAALQEARLAPHHRAVVDALPTGAFFLWQGQPHLRIGGEVWPYLAGAYLAPVPPPKGEVEVLTPAPLIAVMRAGWQPVMDRSADRPNW